MLFGKTEEGNPAVYVGQTGDLKSRLSTHQKEKDFWERALIVISKTNSLTQTHALFLEWHCIQTCRSVGRFTETNGNSGSEPYTPPPMQADCMEIFETASTLLSTLGYPIFESLAKPEGDSESSRYLYCKRPGTDGRGQYTSEGFVVFQGSVGNLEITSSIGTGVERKRNELQKTGAYRIDDGQIVLERDCLFNSPSMASAFLAGKASNGWIDWKDSSGRTLDELERQNTSDESTPSASE